MPLANTILTRLVHRMTAVVHHHYFHHRVFLAQIRLHFQLLRLGRLCQVKILQTLPPRHLQHQMVATQILIQIAIVTWLMTTISIKSA